jgi:putative isomerase
MMDVNASVSESVGAGKAWPDWSAALFDASRLPFSRRGSFLSVSQLEDGAHWLRNLRGGDEHTDVGRLFKLVPLDAQGLPARGAWIIEPDQLRFEGPGGALALAFADGDTLALRGHGFGLRLSLKSKHYDYAQRLADAVHISCATQDLSARVALTLGELQLSAPWQGQKAERILLDLKPDGDGLLAGALHVYRVQPARRDVAQFDAARQGAASDFQAWLAQTMDVAPGLQAGRLLAAYITWSCLVPAEGQLQHPAMYMSKNWMTNIWSWDHCFNALALGTQQAELAWQQLALLFGHQHASGRLPDFVNDRYAYWRFTKPPVHGWTIAQLRRMAPQAWGPARCAQAYQWLQAQLHSWMPADDQGLPAYDHGNDAGWDNATVFLQGTPLQSPDLSALLVTQMDELAALAEALDRPAAAAQWQARADALTARLLQQLWTGTRFVARRADGAAVDAGDSLIAFVPLLLGPRLPAALREPLLAELMAPGRFLTDHGLATESLRSPHYRDDGYWRGPIWAPTMLLFVSAMDRCGRADLGDELARRFTAMAARSGMAENFDARSGAGLRDPAFTWTSSVFLLLGHRLAHRPSPP